MTLALYVPTPSPLHRLHPVTKVAGLGALVIAAFVVDAPAYLLPLGAVVTALLVLAGAGELVRRLRRFVPIVVPVLIGALRRADRMAMALELRGFNSGRPRTTYLRARAGTADAVAGVVVVATAAAYVALWASGVGRLSPLSGGR